MRRNPIISFKPELKVISHSFRKDPPSAEALLWKRIKRKKLGVQFHRQVPVHHYILDFYCSELKMGIEVKNSSDEEPTQKIKNHIRDYVLNQLGIAVIRVEDSDIKDKIDSVITFLEYRISQIRQANALPDSLRAREGRITFLL